MVTKRKFNRIKRENPESRIGKRTREEQQIRNDLAEILIKARKKGIKIPYESYVDRIYREKSKYLEAVNENTSLKEENMELQKQEPANIKLKNLAIDRDKFIKGFPFGLVDKMRNDESLILALKGLIELARNLEYHHGWAFRNSEFGIKGFEKLVTNKKEYLDDIKGARRRISNIFEEYGLNEYLPELLEDFENYFDMKEEICHCEKEEELNKYGGKYSDTLFKLPGKIRKAYADLLNPIIVEIGKIIADDCPASAKKTIGEYIARSGLLPVFWYKGEEDKSSSFWIPAGTGLYDYRYDHRALESRSEIKPVLNVLDLCGVYYKYRYDEGDFQIDIGDSQEAPIPGGDFMKYEIDSKDILSNNIELIKNINKLKQADLVLVYRNNQTYSGLSDELQKMIKNQYGGNVFCVTFSKDIDNLDEFGKERLKMLLTSCNCLTDDTVSKWAGIQTQKIEDIIDNTMTDRLMNTFTVEINELKSRLLSRGIQDVYIPTDNITDHGYIKKVNDGSFKYDYHGGSIQDRYNFRLEMFKDSGIKLHFGNYDSDTNKTAIICDRHCSNEISRGFKYRIDFAGNYFEPNEGFGIGSGKGGGFSKGELIAHKLFE